MAGLVSGPTWSQPPREVVSPWSLGRIDRAADHCQGHCSELFCGAEIAAEGLKLPFIKGEDNVRSRERIIVMIRRGAPLVRRVLGPRLTRCAIVGELLNLFAPQFSHLHNGHNTRVAVINNEEGI